MPIQLYDIALDQMREVTQQDVDALVNAANNFANLRGQVEALARTIAEMHNEHLKRFDPEQHLFHTQLLAAKEAGAKEGIDKFWAKRLEEKS